MRKVMWCCWAAGALATCSFLSLAFYACRCPDSLVGRSMQVIAEASIAMQPLSGITSMAMRTNRAGCPAHETASPLVLDIPADPQPVAHQEKEDAVVGSLPHEGGEEDAAPIVIPEEDPMPRKDAPVIGPSIVVNERNFEIQEMQGHEVPAKGCPTVMPYCRDEDEEAAPPPNMPRADAGEKMEHTVFKAWMELFAESKDEKAPAVEELPPPTEEQPQAEPKCQEDSHLHEHYPGCPRTTCPFTDRNTIEQYFKRVWDLNSKVKKKGGEESSEEPHPAKDCKDKAECPRTRGVDTMEYRKSDAGLDEYGPGPVH